MKQQISGFHVLIAAAGQGLRAGGVLPKQYAKIAGKTILRHTIDQVLLWPGLRSLHVIIDPGHADLYREAVDGLELPPPLIGGKERKDSIKNALGSLDNIGNEDILLIHDAARPFVRTVDVMRLVEALRGSHRAATLAAPVADTLRRSDGGDAGQGVDRAGLWALQTPQGFHFGDIRMAHRLAYPDAAYTDDTALVSEAGIPVKLVEGSRGNFKITTAEDLQLAEALLSSVCEIRTGTGFDVHAFEAAENIGRPLVLCGIRVEHPRALEGHSDADVALHALTDALLGAIGEGDIGLHFPPSNPAFKNMDSRIFLEKSVDMLVEKGGTILNVDVTLICEAPKIGPHRDAMRAKVAEILKIDAGRVNIKATTTERLGFTGRREGIAAQAAATVKLPGAA